MNQDNKVIGYLSPGEMSALMTETGMITVHETAIADGKPVIHAALKVVNAQTGEQLPGGLPFSVVMFKSAREPGYSNIAIGTIVPAAELDISLPRDYFNFCNQRFRFTRVFPLDERSFVLQMDLFVHSATREYVKFSFGVWASMFSQVLFELMGRGRETLVAAAEAYAAVRTDFSQQYVATATASDEAPVVETVAESAPEPEAPSEPVHEHPAETAVGPETAEAAPVAEAVVGDPSAEEAAPAAEPSAEEPVAEAVTETVAADPAAPEPVTETAETVSDADHKEPVAA